MDPLSIAASFIGIATAAGQVSRLLRAFLESTKQASSTASSVLAEVTGISACLHQLQDFLLGHDDTGRSRRSLILIEQVIVVFTDCVTVFSELERLLEGLTTKEHMRVIDRVKWARKEATVSRILTRLQASKGSLNLMLTISNCKSMDSAEASVRDLTGLVQEVLRNNVNMALRLKNLERMHPAFASSRSVSHIERRPSDKSEMRAVNRTTCYNFAFEDELKASAVYKRALLRNMRISTSSGSSNGPSWFSGLSLSDVSNVSALALPIYRTELWNHRHYTLEATASKVTATSLEAWYNPPAKKSAFIRTAYFNGQYTNQYAQSKFTGHLMYRRFTIPAPDGPPVFMEGMTLPLERIKEEHFGCEEVFELEAKAMIPARPPSRYELPASVSRFVDKELPPEPETNDEICSMIDEAKALDNPGEEDDIHTYLMATPDPKAHPRTRSPLPPSKRKPKRSRLRSDHIALQQQRQLFYALEVAAKMHSDSSSSSFARGIGDSPTCSMLCEEEESVFPRRVWKKPLAGMGKAERWRSEVLGKFEQIAY